MDINKLEYFFAAAELQNFTQAAEKCNIAQTTMSKYIVSLEAEASVSLFHRTNKGCHLTEQGQLFYAGMKKLYSDYNDILGQLLSDQQAELRIGIDGEFFRLASLQAFENTYRNITLSLSFGTKEKLFEDLRKQRIHAVILPDVILPESLRDTGFVRVDLMSEEGLLTYSSVTQDRFATIGDMLETLPFITKSSDHSYHEYCREVLFKHYGSRFRDVQVVESGSKQQLLVSLSQGFAIIPSSEIASGMDLRQRAIGDEFSETLQLVYNRSHVTAYLREFIRFVQSRSKL
ncbi:MAG: LysR family transcriptional regulator [Mogibacterium sp.]|nr:LysR family transcriptional regulator [Mogibacterium sp.]